MKFYLLNFLNQSSHRDVLFSLEKLDQVIHLSDIEPPKGVTFIALSHDSDLPIVSIRKAKGASTDPEPEVDSGVEGESEEEE